MPKSSILICQSERVAQQDVFADSEFRMTRVDCKLQLSGWRGEYCIMQNMADLFDEIDVELLLEISKRGQRRVVWESQVQSMHLRHASRSNHKPTERSAGFSVACGIYRRQKPREDAASGPGPFETHMRLCPGTKRLKKTRNS